jgi:hypothetical protein
MLGSGVILAQVLSHAFRLLTILGFRGVRSELSEVFEQHPVDENVATAHGQLFLLRANKQCATQAAVEASYSSVTLKVIRSPRCSGQDAV